MSAVSGMRNLQRMADDYVAFLNSINWIGSNEWRYEDSVVCAKGHTGIIRVNFRCNCRSDVVELPYAALDNVDLMEVMFRNEKTTKTS